MVNEKQYANLQKRFFEWKDDWPRFARECLGVYLDIDQEAILRSFQLNRMTSVVSGTARGKDFVAAVAAMCFMYLTPRWNDKFELIHNTKVALTAPTDRQIGNIMIPEIHRLYRKATSILGFPLPGRLVAYDIRTHDKEWFLTGFKADDTTPEVWTGFHAVNTAFIVTEATGISEITFEGIEGNLQGNSRLLIVFNHNRTTGYAHNSQSSPRFTKFRLSCLNAPNVVEKKIRIPAQVDYEWVQDKVKSWCIQISIKDFKTEQGDFFWEGRFYRPNDLFRVKVLGLAPKVAEGSLVPPEWVKEANQRWLEYNAIDPKSVIRPRYPLRLGVDVAGMGRDSTCFCHRFRDFVQKFEQVHSAGVANHMAIAGRTLAILKQDLNMSRGNYPQAFLDTIGEGAGVYSRLIEVTDIPLPNRLDDPLKGKIHSVKFSESADIGGAPLKDVTGMREFFNMRAYLAWAVRDWLDPDNKSKAMLPPDEELLQELTETKWEYMSNAKIKIEPKEDIKDRLKRSPDKFDALLNTFYPVQDFEPTKQILHRNSDYL